MSHNPKKAQILAAARAASTETKVPPVDITTPWEIVRKGVPTFAVIRERYVYEKGALVEYTRIDPDLGGPARSFFW